MSMDFPTANQPGDAEYAAWSQPIGPSVPTHAAPIPSSVPLHGKHVDLLPPSTRHVTDFWSAFAAHPEHDKLHTYMLDGPWVDQAGFEEHQNKFVQQKGIAFFALVPKGDEVAADTCNGAEPPALGRFALINVAPYNRSCEVGHVILSPKLQRTKAATEAFLLLGRHVFEDLGYRRWEWKCNNLNAPSKRAAERYGFRFEGVFRKHYIVKGRSRDTAWFSIIDDEWPLCRAAFEEWLKDDNFDAQGRQKLGLKEVRERLEREWESKKVTMPEVKDGERGR